jgi:DNA uptake protein ComE-like DNA-binding protein
MRAFEFLAEADKPKVGRTLQHFEDMVIVDGSRGALEALGELSSMAKSVDDVTVKWDGSPAVFFGRNEQGQFVLTDGNAFTAKGYEGKVTSQVDLERMLMTRGKQDPEKAASRREFAGKMGGLWDRLEAMIAPTFRGYIKGDLLYFNAPQKDKNGDYTFTPNTVTYHIPPGSSIGQQMSKSTAGIAVHSFTSLDGNSQPLKGPIKGIQPGEVMIQGPVVVNHMPAIDDRSIEKVKQFVTQHANDIDSLLDDQRLAAEKMSDLKATLYTFVNQQVDTGDLTNLNAKFDKWLTTSKVSGPKQAKIQDYRKSHSTAFAAIFSTLEQIMAIKDDVIGQLDSKAEVKQSINGRPGGEGYVKGTGFKAVPRLHFSQANRAKPR